MAYDSASDTFDEDTLQKMAELGLIDDKQDHTALQLKLAAALRNKETPQGHNVGQQWIPPSAMDSFLGGFDKGQGIIGMGDADKKMGALNDEKGAGILNFMKQWSQSKKDEGLRSMTKMDLQSLADKLKDDQEWPTL